MSLQPQLRPILRQNNAVDPDDPTFQAARETLYRTREFFQPYSPYIKFRAVLGFGSSGAVTLWPVMSHSGRFQDVAIKTPHDENDDLFRQEIQWMEKFSSAEHFIQLARLPSYALNSALYNNSKSEGPPLIVMKYAERCELNELLLGDLGLMTEFDLDWTDEEKIAAVTDIGRPNYVAPEQRDRERPLRENAFGPHTNIWGVGLLMYNALTLYQVVADDGDWAPRACPITMPDGSAKNLVTWAPFLVGREELVYDEFKAYGDDLRTLIARCMADEPEDRPGLQELLDTTTKNIAAGDRIAAAAQEGWERQKEGYPGRREGPVDVSRPPEVEDDDLVRRFFREYLNDPPARGDPYRDYW
ncbi:hypothetical protein GGS23DRAFT_616193 [Durotheca rogersii]|uniref:uncharacterized protein n=1 Tax=Durotheca rogersii TaxID=419775 RepID=UPI00221FDA30|nr:uncharacterized protein GGS23DRAFT_616193 [Durotheca rogersii]KAI5859501.1 hypothetical protein GGS23DRAFT_616193 [Durotheca rogersii]